MYRLRETEHKKYDFWGCWFKPFIVKVLPNILGIAFLTVLILIICYKYVATKEHTTVYQSAEEITETVETADKHTSQLESLASAEVGNSYYQAEPTLIVYPVAPIQSCTLSAPMQLWVKDTCEVYNVDFYVVVSMMWHESRYNADAYNANSNCIGLMQINQDYHSVQDSQGNTLDLSTPCLNVLKGIQLMSGYLERYEGDYTQALTYYSGGSTVYANSVLEYAERLRNE